MIEGEFIYRLVTEKDHYSQGKDVKIYAELEYVGEEEIEISHGSSPFYFPMSETTITYDIGYAVNLPHLVSTMKKGELLREEARVGGSYSEQDKKSYQDFMKRVMKQDYPSGHYIVDGAVKFTLEGENEKEYSMSTQVEFYVDNEK